ncbi:MAG TPA: PaaI family thioesterase [Pseudolabrys sp.]|nr:PaaI family thioesterase [Pseudolabrys sp.]
MATRIYGTVSSERQKAMSGLEFVKGLATGLLPLNTIAQTLGYDVVEAERGRVAITLIPTGAHLNPWGTVHGGLTATLLDSCMGLAVQSMLEKGISSTTLEFKISLVRAITLDTGQIRAEGKVLNCGRRVGTAEGHVTDAKGRLLAHGTTTCLILASEDGHIRTTELS